MHALIFASLVGIALLSGCGQAADKAQSGGSAVTGSGALGLEGTALAQERTEERGLVGPWLLSDPSNPGFTALHTFTSEGEVLVIASPPPAGGGQGAWTRVGPHEFLSTFLLVVRNPATPTKKHSMHITLTDHDSAFTGTLIVQNCDAAGENCVRVPGTETHTGKRIAVEDLQ